MPDERKPGFGPEGPGGKGPGEKGPDKAEQNRGNTNGMRVPGMGPGPRHGAMAEKPKDGKNTIKKIIGYFVKEKLMLITILVVVIILVFTNIYAPKLQSEAIDLITTGTLTRLPKILLIMLIVYLVGAACTWGQAYVGAHLSQRIVKRMRSDLFSRMVRLPISYLDTHGHGDIMSRMTNDVENISNTVSQSFASLISGVFTIAGTMAMMFYLCWQMALLSMTTVILTLVVTRLLSAKMRDLFRERQALLGQVNGTVEEMVTGYRTVVAYNHQAASKKEFNATSDRLTHVSIWAECIGGSMGPIMNVISNLGFIIIAVFGGYFAIHGTISVGVISAFIVYAKQFGRPINEIAQLYAQIQTAIAGAERVFAVLDEEEEANTGTLTMKEEPGLLSFSHVDFSYIPGKQVLYDFNLDVPAGHKIALVGATGSGKTTVVNLLMRFYDVDRGQILIDGVDIRSLDRKNLRKNTAIVLQDTVLFTDTIRNNLKYSKLDATDEEMEEAAKMSKVSGVITRMKDGYDTLLTEAGGNLSQGQRQLLSIGRAFLANPKILILDEATSSVDTRTEKRIQNAMVNLMKNRTSLIIAHRLSTVRDADTIVVMDHGRIVECGNHDALMEQQGRYYELYQTQFAGNSI